MGLAVAMSCTPSAAPVEHTVADPPPTLSLGEMYWAPELYVLGGDYGLVFTAEVTEATSRASDPPHLRGPTIHDATLRVHRVLHQGPVPSADGPVPQLSAGDTVITDAAAGLAVGDRVLVFATTYEGGYAIAPARGTTTPMGIALSTFEDPIVTSTARWLSGAPDFPNAEDAVAWRPYSEDALRCLREGVPVSHCGSYDDDDGRTQP